MLVVLLHLAATETAKPFMQCTKEHLRPTDDDNGGWFIEPACTELRLAMQMMGDDGVLAMAESLKAQLDAIAKKREEEAKRPER